LSKKSIFYCGVYSLLEDKKRKKYFCAKIILEKIFLEKKNIFEFFVPKSDYVSSVVKKQIRKKTKKNISGKNLKKKIFWKFCQKKVFLVCLIIDPSWKQGIFVQWGGGIIKQFWVCWVFYSCIHS
jgi:hypothetical protein